MSIFCYGTKNSSFTDGIICAAVLLVSTLIKSPLLADELVVRGLALRGVDAKAVEGDTIRLSKGKIEKLVHTAEFRQEGVALAFADEAFKKTLTDERLVKFSKDSISDADSGSAALAIAELLSRGSRYAHEALFSGAFSPLGKTIIDILSKRSVVSESVYAAHCVVEHQFCVTIPQEKRNEVRTNLEEQIVVALRRRDKDATTLLIPALKTFAPDQANAIEQFLQLIDEVSRSSVGEASASLDGIAEILRADPLLVKSGYVLYVDIIHGLATKSIAEKKYGEALQVLSLVPQQWKGERTNVLTVQALDGITTPNEIGFSIAIAEYLRRMSESDATIRKAYRLYLERILAHALATNEKGVFTTLFKEYLVLNPDPSSKNDEYRYAIGILHLHDGNYEAAHQEVEQIRTGISFFQKIRLMLLGYYYRFGWVFISFIAAVVGGFLIFLREQKARKVKTRVAQRELKQKMATNKERSPSSEYKQTGGEKSFRSLARMTEYQAPTDPRQIELIGLLGKLGLEVGATEKDVKQAFRQIAKAVHPDMAQTGDSKASDEFIELTKAYERALTIISELYSIQTEPSEES